jgi:hypothetical protein
VREQARLASLVCGKRETGSEFPAVFFQPVYERFYFFRHKNAPYLLAIDILSVCCFFRQFNFPRNA